MRAVMTGCGVAAALVGACSAVALLAASARADAPTQITSLDDDINDTAAQQQAHGLLVAPIPVVDPQLGQGAVLAGGYFYSPVQGGRPWVTGVAGLLARPSFRPIPTFRIRNRS